MHTSDLLKKTTVTLYLPKPAKFNNLKAIPFTSSKDIFQTISSKAKRKGLPLQGPRSLHSNADSTAIPLTSTILLLLLLLLLVCIGLLQWRRVQCIYTYYYYSQADPSSSVKIFYNIYLNACRDKTRRDRFFTTTVRDLQSFFCSIAASSLPRQ